MVSSVPALIISLLKNPSFGKRVSSSTYTDWTNRFGSQECWNQKQLKFIKNTLNTIMIIEYQHWWIVTRFHCIRHPQHSHRYLIFVPAQENGLHYHFARIQKSSSRMVELHREIWFDVFSLVHHRNHCPIHRNQFEILAIWIETLCFVYRPLNHPTDLLHNCTRTFLPVCLRLLLHPSPCFES